MERCSTKQNPLTELPNFQIKLYGILGLTPSIFYETQEQQDKYITENEIPTFAEIGTIEYLGRVAQRKGVIKKQIKMGNMTYIVQ